MQEFIQNEIKNLFSNLCCSKCKNDFDKDSIKIIETQGNLMICSLRCTKCDKDFGEIIFNYNVKAHAHNPMEIIEGPAPITSDDVIDAHNYIKKFM